jgi:hypothetical protein
MIFDRHVAPLDVSSFVQGWLNARKRRVKPGGRLAAEEPDHRLRTRCERPYRCTPEQCDEPAPSHELPSNEARLVDQI